MRTVPRVDREHEVRAGDGDHVRGESACRFLLGEDPVGTGGHDEPAIGKYGLAADRARVGHRISGRRSGGALPGLDCGVTPVPLPAGGLVRDRRPAPHRRARVRCARLDACGVGAVVCARVRRALIVARVRRRRGVRNGVGAASGGDARQDSTREDMSSRAANDNNRTVGLRPPDLFHAAMIALSVCDRNRAGASVTPSSHDLC